MNKKLTTFVFLLCIFLFASSSVFSQTATNGELSGTIKFRGELMSNAAVTATNISTSFSRTTMTNAEGYYRFTNLPVGRYTIRVSMTGFKEKRIEANVGIGQMTVFDIDLDEDVTYAVSLLGSITGKVTDREDNIIKGAKLSYAKKDSPQDKKEVEIDEDGEFSIPELSAGKYILFFEAEGFQPKRKEVRIKNKEKKIEVELKRK